MVRINGIKEWFFLILFIIVSAMACSQPSGSGFLRKEFLEYENVAILPFEGDDTGEMSRAFAGIFKKDSPRFRFWVGGRSWTTPEKINSTFTNWMMQRG